MERLLDGFYTLDDQTMYDMLGWLAAAENIRLEPSALAGMAGAQRVCASKAYHQLQGLSEQQLQQATHRVGHRRRHGAGRGDGAVHGEGALIFSAAAASAPLVAAAVVAGPASLAYRAR